MHDKRGMFITYLLNNLVYRKFLHRKFCKFCIQNASNATSPAKNMLQMPQVLHTKYCTFRKSCIQNDASPAYKMTQDLHTKCCKCGKSCIQNAANPVYKMPQVLHTKCLLQMSQVLNT